MIENNCSCSVLSNKIDKSVIRRYDNNKGRKRSGLDKSKLQAVEKAIESLAVQGFLPVRRAPLVRALASHARGRRFESASLHHQAAPKKMPLRKAQKFQLFHPLGTQCVIGVQLVRAKARRKLMHLSLRLAFYIRIELRRNVSVKPNRA